MAASGGDSISLGSSGSSKRSRMSREELSFETRQVVIDFLGLIPAPALSASNASSGSDERRKKLKKTDSSASGTSDVSSDNVDLNRSGDGHTWKQRLASLPEVSLVDKYPHLEDGGSVLTPQHSEDVQQGEHEGPGGWIGEGGGEEEDTFPVNVTVDRDSDEDRLLSGGDVSDQAVVPAGAMGGDLPPATRPSSIPLSGEAYHYARTQAGSRSPSKPVGKGKNSPVVTKSSSINRDAFQRQGAIDRQISNISECSDSSHPLSDCSSSFLMASLRSGMSQRSNHVDITQLDSVDVGNLVRNNTLPPLTLPLKEELDRRKEELNKEYEEKHPGQAPVPMTPQTEVAMMLAVIGDRVQEEYGAQLASAASVVSSQSEVSYDVVDHVASELIEAVPDGWKKATILLLFGRELAMSVISHGKKLGGLIDMVAQVIEDKTADFIVEKGGWHSITALEDVSPVSPSDILPEIPAPSNPFDYDELDMGGRVLEGGATTAGDVTSPQSLADSAISPDMSRSDAAPTPGGQGDVPRDYSVDSLAGITVSGLPSPADPTLLFPGMTGGGLPAPTDPAQLFLNLQGDSPGEDGLDDADITAKASKEDASQTTSVHVHADSMEKPSPTVSSSQERTITTTTPEDGPCLPSGASIPQDGPLSPEIASVQREIQMLRQISRTFPEERREASDKEWRFNMTLGIAGGIIVAIASYMLYKKLS